MSERIPSCRVTAIARARGLEVGDVMLYAWGQVLTFRGRHDDISEHCFVASERLMEKIGVDGLFDLGEALSAMFVETGMYR